MAIFVCSFPLDVKLQQLLTNRFLAHKIAHFCTMGHALHLNSVCYTCEQLSSMASLQAVAVAAGKYRTAVATTTGNVYLWDGEGNKADVLPSPIRVYGAKHITRLSVGETHSLAVASLYGPTYSTKPVNDLPAVSKATGEGEESTDEEADVEEEPETLGAVAPNKVDEGVPSLKDLCQKVVADSIVEPKNALQLLEFADSLGADHLKRYCEVNSSYTSLIF